ncbi:iron ABC transporter permease [Kribbella sp. NPDC050820]|uniref:FecCD family ABC transporter permease n=1 Tax=Kribbella sp. NPDC050820 TaxID=3155408 RepID=UPI003409293C
MSNLDLRPAGSGIQPVDDLDHARRRRHILVWVGGLTLALLCALPVAVGLGPVRIAPGTVAKVVGHHLIGWPDTVTWSAADDSIVWLVRLPRVLLGAVVGAALAVSGVALQAMVRNVLADPHILGVTSGASTGAAASILFGAGIGAGTAALTASAFAGALAATAVLFTVARLNGQITSIRLLLAGVTIGYILSATTSFLIFASDSPEGARTVLFWLLGSLSSARWAAVGTTGALVVAVTAVLILLGNRLDALAIGDDTARTFGIAPARLRGQALVVVALGIGAVVAVSGAIGFVGLIVPHIARLCVGGAHRRAVPVAALVGALFLVSADVFARTAFAPRELPLGIVTAVVGAPLLLVLIRQFHPTHP